MKDPLIHVTNHNQDCHSNFMFPNPDNYDFLQNMYNGITNKYIQIYVNK